MNVFMHSIQVIGDAETVLAFALGGVPGQVAKTGEEARAAIDTAVERVQAGGGPAQVPLLLIITRATAAHVRTTLDRLMIDPGAPLVVEIPGAPEGLNSP